MKLIIVFFGLVTILPFMARVMAAPEYRKFVWRGYGLLAFAYSAIPQFGISVISWEGYTGHTKGIEVTILDLVTLGILLGRSKSQPRASTPFRLPMSLFGLAALFSVMISEVPMASLFFVWQILRMYIIFLAVARMCESNENQRDLFIGFAAGIIVELFMVLSQKFLSGAVQPHGTFAHQNTLGMIINMISLVMLGLFLRVPQPKIITMALPAAIFTSALTASRASLGLALIGWGLNIVAGIARKPNPRTLAIAAGAIVLLIPVSFVGYTTFQSRLANQEAADGGGGTYDERKAYIDAAKMIIDDYPLGIGANRFVIVANSQGYYDRAEITATFGSRSGHVHNLYWLTWAEMGPQGLAALLFLLASPMFYAFRLGWKHFATEEGGTLRALAIALLITYVHSWYEWILITADPQYFLAILFGLVASNGLRLSKDKWQPSTGAKRGRP